jgi:hypothetical protein
MNDEGEEVELRLCPFCKSGDIELLTGKAVGKGKKYYQPYCHGCGCTLTTEDSEEKAAAIWNCRPVEDEAFSLLRELASETYDEQSLIRRANKLLACAGKGVGK